MLTHGSHFDFPKTTLILYDSILYIFNIINFRGNSLGGAGYEYFHQKECSKLNGKKMISHKHLINIETVLTFNIYGGFDQRTLLHFIKPNCSE